MKLARAWVELEARGKKVQAYTVAPGSPRAPLPGVVLIQEAFGVDDYIQDVAERLGAAGYAVIAPDLYSFGGKPESLAPARIEQAKALLDGAPAAWADADARAEAIARRPEGERKKLEDTLATLLPPERPWEAWMATLLAARKHLSGNGAQGRKVASLGFCLGGTLSLRLAMEDPELAAAVVFYGFPPPLEGVPGLKAPVLGLYAEKDPRIAAALPALERALKDQGKSFEHHVYPNAKHAFMNDTRTSYDPEASRDAWARTLMFLAQKL